MVFILLRNCLSTTFLQRCQYISSRTLSGKPITELANSVLNQQADHTNSSKSDIDSTAVSHENPVKTPLSNIRINLNSENLNSSKSDLDSKSVSKNGHYESIVSNLSNNLKAQDALQILRTLRKLSINGDIHPSTFVNEKRFIKICSTFQKDCNNIRLEQLVNGLRCLLELGLSPNLELVQVIENEILWKSRKMSVKTLCMCLDFHAPFQETKQQVQVVRALASHITSRWVEIEHASDVIIILNNKNFFDEQFIGKVEDKVLEFADKVTIDEIVLLLTTFSKHKRRSASVLRALLYYLVQKQDVLTLRQCCDLCFALSSLRVFDGNVLNKITMDALTRIESNNSGPLVSSLLTSLSLLKWDHSALLESCCEWIEKNVDKWRKRDWASLVLTLAHLNYQPENHQVLFPLALQSLKTTSTTTEDSNALTLSIWLDVVWALAVLGKATQQHLSSTLEPTFYEKLIKDEIPNSVIYKLKLQNIDAVARVELPMARVPALKPFDKFQVPISSVDKKMKQSIMEALQTYLPPPKYLALNLTTNLGFNIVAEFIVDENGKPVPIVDYGVKAGTTKELKHLPVNCKRIALLCWGFKDVTNKTSRTTGMNALSVRLLTKLGYTVVEVPYQEYQTLKTTLQQVMYLQQKIKDRVLKK